MLAVVLAAVLQIALLAPAKAQPTRTWNGSQSTDWKNPHNWSPSGGPEGTIVIPTAPGPVINGDRIQIKGPLSITGDTSLTIENGGSYRHHGPVDIYVGSPVGSAQLFLQSGATLAGAGGTIRVGEVGGAFPAPGTPGTGHVVVSGGATVSDVTIHLASPGNSHGTLNIGAKPGEAAQAPGSVTGSSSVQFGAGKGEINFNHTSTSYAFDVPISGHGEVNVYNGTTVFNIHHTYTGNTTIFGGTLLVNGSIQTPTTVLMPGTLGGNGAINNNVDNFGIVSPGTSIGDLHITGAYVGYDHATLKIESVLAGNNSPTDHLILVGPTASASGATGIVVVNLGGAGALTTGNGIPVVIVTGGATTQTTAFYQGGPIAAGPFQYVLSRGTIGSAADLNGWYLRSHGGGTPLTQGPGPVVGGGGSPTAQGPGPVLGGGAGGAGGGGVPLGPGPVIGDGDGPLYRPETATYGLFPALARGLAVSTIGSFHERNGDQALVEGSKRERLWGRIFGHHAEQGHGGHVTPSFEGHAAGFQIGADAYEETMWENGMRGRAGVFLGWAEARGDIKGSVLGHLETVAGAVQLEATSVGSYGTVVGYGGWYLDSIVMTSFYQGDGQSANGISTPMDGNSVLASLEAGIPFQLVGGFTLEPQAQLIYQYLDLDKTVDAFSTVRFNTPDAVLGRIGVRLAGVFADGRFRPYLKANIWQDWLDGDRVIYADTHALDTDHGGTALEVGGGLVLEMAPGVGLWSVLDYTTDIAGDVEREVLRGNAGVRITW